jgi:hypothetical protein
VGAGIVVLKESENLKFVNITKAFVYFFVIYLSLLSLSVRAQEALYKPEHSVARNWNEALLFAIRNDFARPTVHARNLYHSSALMYDIWALYDDVASPVFLGERSGLQACAFDGSQKQQLVSMALDIPQAREKAISYGMYRLLTHRFNVSPGQRESQIAFVEMSEFFGVEQSFVSMDFASDGAPALGNYIANCLIEYGLQDGANEQNFYQNTQYEPVNMRLDPNEAGNPTISNSDRWQPLALDIFIDQAGNETGIPPFLGAEWGKVTPFALKEQSKNMYRRDGIEFPVYHDPGVPAYLLGDQAIAGEYQWNHALVALWSSHLDPTDGVMWDISPRSIGNTNELPQSIEALRNFYLSIEGGAGDRGHAMNPSTSAPYVSQLVPRGDYTRVLAEFWADGPDSETPPGHWYTILNDAVSDHPDFTSRYRGQGEALSPLEWDVKAYLALGGAMHDSAISAWSIKGYYDYIRPISAIRHMADYGQSSDPDLSTYHPLGLPLFDGKIELVEMEDPLAGAQGQNVGKVKLYAWKGPDAIVDPQTDTAGVAWILAENWWPYQRPSFVTPPFAGYVSGHSTFSRAAAEVLSMITGDEFFPGGMAQFVARKNEFLVFEQGPSVDITLQWATYRDASDQTSLSRIWGGIHPPVDDVPGRRIGIQVGLDATALAEEYFSGRENPLVLPSPPPPNPPEIFQPDPANGSGGGATSGFMLILFALLGLRRVKR